MARPGGVTQDRRMGSPAPPGRRQVSPWPHVIWACLVIAVVAVLLVAAASTEQPEGQCSGIGRGCTLSGGDLAELVAAFILPPAFVVLMAGHVVIRTAQRRRRR